MVGHAARVRLVHATLLPTTVHVLMQHISGSLNLAAISTDCPRLEALIRDLSMSELRRHLLDSPEGAIDAIALHAALTVYSLTLEAADGGNCEAILPTSRRPKDYLVIALQWWKMVNNETSGTERPPLHPRWPAVRAGGWR